MPRQTYAVRNATLREMGYRSYAEYLRSPLWDGIRRAALQHYKHKCRLCGGWANQVHHLSYSRTVLERCNVGLMAAVCGPCHAAIEFDQDGRKRTCREAALAFSALRKAARKRGVGIKPRCPQCGGKKAVKKPACNRCLRHMKQPSSKRRQA